MSAILLQHTEHTDGSEMLHLSGADLSALSVRAAVPEHSVPFMQAMSGGKVLLRGDYVFYTADDWLMAMGYKLGCAATLHGISEDYRMVSDTVFDMASFEAALEEALEATGAERCWAIAPELPERLRPFTENQDVLFTLGAGAPVPELLRGPVRKAGMRLTVREGRDFTAGHRRLWAEFLGRVTMRPNVRALYAGTDAALALAREGKTGLDLRLLDAVDTEGNITASLLLDYTPAAFSSYIIGAHSREHYAPHATDLLFSAMLQKAQAEGKSFVHLGLGVNEGITRFKRKWRGEVRAPYAMAAWKEAPRKAAGSTRKEVDRAMRALLEAPPGLSKQQIFDTFPKQRTFAMIREVRKGDAVSYLCGTAHFFCYSFELSFREIFEPLDTIIFEGPLDEDFLAAVEKHGRNPEKGAPSTADTLTEEEIREVERMVYGPEGFAARLLGMQQPRRVDVRGLLNDTRPWFAFFSLWVAFLERQGWSQSVDLEAWHTAKDMGKQVIGMENLEEQIDSLEVIPLPRVTDFLRRVRHWPSYMKRNIASYLDGDLDLMLGTSIEFPSRTEQVIDRRDERFRQRMRPFLEAGNCAVFVGSAHLIGLTPMLEADGFTVRPHYPGKALRMKAGLRKLFSGKTD